MFRQSRPFSYSPSFRGFSQEDYPQQRRPTHHDDFRGAPVQRNGMFRLNGKSIYRQRKDYSETLSRESETHFRVEHLLTCELDGQELKTLDNCMSKLKRLDGKGRLWPQQMIMEVHRGYLVLSDIETKVELEAIPLRWVLEAKAVLDSCAYNSVLIITVDERNKRSPQVYMFQCEETGAEVIKADLDKVIDYRSGPTRNEDIVEPPKAQPDIKINLENIIGKHFRQPDSYIMPQEKNPPLDFPPPQWREPDMLPPPRPYSPQDYFTRSLDVQDPRRSPEAPALVHQDANNNTEIFNHVLDDVETFMDKVSMASSAQEEKSQKKKGFMKKKKKAAPVSNLPPPEEYISFLQKVKYGFNLLAQLQGVLAYPSSSDFVHVLFSILSMTVPRYPAELPPSVVSPLLTDGALQLLGVTTSNEEKQLWGSLGDSWNISRSRWPEDIPPYIPQFYDGWQPPTPAPPPYQNHSPEQFSRSNSQIQPEYEQPVRDEPWNSQPPRSSEPPMYARAIYDFTARNSQELTVTKGDVVQVVKMSNNWWLIRNNRGEEGNVPRNVVELTRSSSPPGDQQWNPGGPVTLDTNSRPQEVKAWLEYKGFSRITVNTLGVLTGKLLLGMTKEEIRTVCPEEGSKVFFQLQAVKSAMALAGEQTGMFGRRY
ncbi:epidermal growth factor receptor kinase substrate 8-like protein 3b [Takifugu flavidus]|uniref:Epidermal growth factor receptor kinase substrate 8-like protein 3 n=1 Tax=Takifugu flavidus TaxID=433684 RepID=A0A5C6MQW8_9TELE|nr:epidermal growth factor receptor kinase substrate 8-like protein 3b [Takifugu flavidus]TWW56561.1 Epidermal growth factor receptor kinase substrate 8-like protein 3 [Takifugu flavidus]